MWCLATLSPSNGVTLVPDVRMWGEQTSAPSVQAAHQLCKGYLFQHSHAVHQSDLQYKNMSFWLAYFICIWWWSVIEQRDIRAPDTQHGWSQRRFWITPQKILRQARSITTPENHHNRYSTTQDPTSTVGQTKIQCIGTFYLCASEKSWLTHLDFHRTLHTGSSGVSKPTLLD